MTDQVADLKRGDLRKAHGKRYKGDGKQAWRGASGCERKGARPHTSV